MQSKNIVFTGKEKVEIITENIRPLKSDEFLCRAEKSLISIGTETICLKGIFDSDTNWNSWVKYPFNPGYSMTATVLEVGSDIAEFSPGDRVACECTHMQYFVAKSNELSKIPDDVTSEEATWVALSRVAQNGVRRANIQMGDSIGIIGTGAVGLLTLQYARICGATKIITIDPIKNRLELALASGASHVIACRAEDAYIKTKEITNGDMLDIIFDTTGHPSVLAPSCKLIRRHGKIILVGDTSEPSKQNIGPGVVSNSLSILGAHGSLVAKESNCFYPWTLKKTTEITFTYISQKRLNVSQLITHHYSPMQAPSVYQKLLHDRSFAMGIIFDWDNL